jgi:hypothetical protein
MGREGAVTGTRLNKPVVVSRLPVGAANWTTLWIVALGFGLVGVPFGFFPAYGQVTGAYALFGLVLAVCAVVKTGSWGACAAMAACGSAVAITVVTQVRFYQDMQELQEILTR